MTVAVLMRTFNDDPRLMRYSVESVLRQTHKDLRLYIHNDGGEYPAWVKERYADDDRIVISDSHKNCGRSTAGNALLARMDEDIDWFTWLDADGDQFGPSYLESFQRMIPALSGCDFWWARPALIAGISVTTECSIVKRITAAQTFFDGNFVNDKRFWIDRFSTPPSFDGGLDLCLPISARGVLFDERADFDEDSGWGIDVGLWAADRFDVFKSTKCVGLSVMSSYDGLPFYIRTLDTKNKYKGGVSFNDVNSKKNVTMNQRSITG